MILLATIILLIIFTLFGLLLGYFAQKFKIDGDDPLIEKIDAILPQTQCGQCGFPGCKPYAKAIAQNKADINQCPPGGQEGVDKLAELLGVESKPINQEHGTTEQKQVAFVIEDWCIGCTKCIQACPVDAIIGSTGKMHTIIKSECTGCKLCVEPCPTSCIEMKPTLPSADNWVAPAPLISKTKINNSSNV